MNARELGFSSSWKMLTRDKGWIKPLLILTLVAWVPILGQIVVLGYGFEWARLTAWGIDSAPKQRGIAYGKVLTTGAIAFLVTFTMDIVLSIVGSVLFGGGFAATMLPLGLLSFFMDGSLGLGAMTGGLLGGLGLLSMLLSFIVSLLASTFVSAAVMRSTLYDSFSAGWRVDRLFQMLVRDFGGFLHTYAVGLIGGIITVAAGCVVGVFAGLALGISVAGGVAGAALGASMYHDLGQFLLSAGALPVLVIVILLLVALFFVQVIGIAMQLVGINAVGQWFCRFDVNRWTLSADPLPDGVPSRGNTGSAASDHAPSAPVTPVAPSAGTPSTGADRPDENAERSASQADREPEEPSVPVAASAPEDGPIVTEHVDEANGSEKDSPIRREPILLGGITEDPAADKGDGEDTPPAA